MNYFKTIKSFEDLKEQFKKLARINHPDAGGNAEIMKEINLQYDALFPIWKSKSSVDKQSTETANSTRRDFYTENGWKGSNHDWNRSLKEVAVIVRAYVKEKYPTFKFSVRTSYASMCKELHVSLKEAPFELYKKLDQLTEEDINGIIRKANRNYEWTLNSWNQEEGKKEIERIWSKCGTSYMVYRDDISEMLKDIDSFVNSYNFSDCDGMTDYFHVDFYYFNCKPDYDFKIVEKTARIKNQAETQEPESKAIENVDTNYTYDIKEDIDTRDNTKIYIVKVVEKLDKDEYIKVNNYIKSIGGYYSKFKRGFIFKNYPGELVGNKENTQQEDIPPVKQQEVQPQEEAKKELEFEIVESKHAETKTNIWFVKIKNTVSKDDFAEIKRNFATLKGFYSSTNNSFIFKYDPTEILKNSA